MKRNFVSLDRHTISAGEYEEPDRYRDLLALRFDTPLIPRGAGLSYVAASFGKDVRSIGMARFDRILSFDPGNCLIEVEAGVTLGKLFDFCTRHNLCLPVQPGHPQITVGGCIAGNVNGKNQFREGLFGEHVRRIRLLHPGSGLIELSRETEPELFALTIGGLGLTGLIVSAELALAPLAAAVVSVEHIAVADLDEAFEQVGRLRANRDMVYAWVDLARSDRGGRGYVVAGTASPNKADDLLAARRSVHRLEPGAKRLRPWIINRHTIPTINALYRYMGLRRSGAWRVPLFDFLFPAVGKEYYFDWFGEGGLVEMQVLIPEAAARDYGRAVIALLRKRDQRIALATIKAFAGQPRLLDYNGSGFSFTIDVENTPSTMALLSELDDLNTATGGRTAVLKDSRLTADVVRKQYPEYEHFRERLRAFDPARVFSSELSRRLEL
jgi:decaprenylphospho-beta-D-ribofuranose 2-oxidase